MAIVISKIAADNIVYDQAILFDILTGTPEMRWASQPYVSCSDLTASP